MSIYYYKTVVASERVQVVLQDLVTQEEKIINVNVAVYTAAPHHWYEIYQGRSREYYPYCVLIEIEGHIWMDPTTRPWYVQKEEAQKRMEMTSSSLRKENLLKYRFIGLEVETRFVLEEGKISLKTVFV